MVVTGNDSLGELLQRSLEETGLYKVMLVDSNQEALLCIQTVAFTIAILDCETPGENLLNLASNMRQKLPKMRLMIICAEENPIYPETVSFQPAGLLKKPVQIPELLDQITIAMQTPAAAFRPAPARNPQTEPNSPSTPPAPEWLQDANWAARHLASLSLETSAEAALIVRDNALWAYAGKLSQAAINELVECLVSFWEGNQHTTVTTALTSHQMDDMVRFIRLEATSGEYMLYGTSLGKGMVLSLVFETNTPFSAIRNEVNFLAKALATPPGSLLPTYARNSTSPSPLTGGDDDKDYALVQHLPLLLDDVPPPSPYTFKEAPGGQKNIPSWFEEASAPASLTEMPPPQQTRTQVTPSERPTSIQPELQKREASPQESVLKPTFVPVNPPRNTAASYKSSVSTNIAKDQNGNGIPIMAPKLLPPTPTLHYLTYSCTLIPRLPQHKLRGDLVRLLQEWMPQLFLAFGWQLLHSGVNPEYLQVIARVVPNTSPGSFVRIIQQQTSKRIFANFPQIAKDNPSHDFWAPGYLILSNSQPPPDHVIQHFIEHTRLQQGFPKAG